MGNWGGMSTLSPGNQPSLGWEQEPAAFTRPSASDSEGASGSKTVKQLLFVVTCFGDSSRGHTPSEVVELSGYKPAHYSGHCVGAFQWRPTAKLFRGPELPWVTQGWGLGRPLHLVQKLQRVRLESGRD